jgi:hypothetical protein
MGNCNCSNVPDTTSLDNPPKAFTTQSQDVVFEQGHSKNASIAREAN